jgi:hypothetical protein
LYLGGLEAAEQLGMGCANPAGITVLVDCRGEPPRWVPAASCRRLFVPATKLTLLPFSTEYFVSWLRPVFEALAAGEQVLLHCVNGKHRSDLGKQLTQPTLSS